jgi:hypothetical protein
LQFLLVANLLGLPSESVQVWVSVAKADMQSAPELEFQLESHPESPSALEQPSESESVHRTASTCVELALVSPAAVSES